MDTSAKLLAQENIKIVRAKTGTASFNLKDRILTLPQYKNLSVEAEDMLTCHEVGHALYTDFDTYTKLFTDETKQYKNYFNIIEDVRIDRMIKEYYPGSKKSYRLGLKALHDMDFFGLNEKAIKDRNFGDRLNLYYKGMSQEIFFTGVEQEFCQRAIEVKTMEEALALAIEIYNYDKENYEEMSEQSDLDEFSFDEDNEGGDQQRENNNGKEDDNNSESDEETADGEQSKGSADERGENENTSSWDNDGETEDSGDSGVNDAFTGEIDSQKSLEKSLEKMVDCDMSYLDLEIKCSDDFKILGFKEFIQKTEYADINKPTNYGYSYHSRRGYYAGISSRTHMEMYLKEFKAEAKELVQYLKKEFDINKSAEELRRAVVTKTGLIDAKRLYAYQLKDDIFKRNTVLKQAKNHGMVFLLDWSSSMTSVMQKTIEQVYVLASFCRACHIPFRVFAFASGSSYGNFDVLDQGEIDVSKYNDVTLFELFSDKMDFNEFKVMSDRLLSTFVWTKTTKYGDIFNLRNTPLNISMMYMLFYIPKFRKMYGLEKVTFVSLSDGLSAPVVNSNTTKAHPRKVISSLIFNKKRFEFRDTDNNNTKVSNVPFTAVETSTLARMIRECTGAITVSLNITSNKTRDVLDALTSNGCSTYYKEEIARHARTVDAYVLPRSSYDLSVIFPKMLHGDEGFDLSSEVASKTSRQIAKEFIKVNQERKRKRIFLDEFIKTVA